MIRPKKDISNDRRCGFSMVKARDIDRVGMNGVIDILKERVRGSKVYISVDIDVLDPAFAPGNSTFHFQLSNAHVTTLFSLFFAPSTHGCVLKILAITATGTSEPGGWSTRELLTILDGLKGMKVIGGDVVEVAPIYDNPGETTVLAAAEVALSLLTLMVQTPVKE